VWMRVVQGPEKVHRPAEAESVDIMAETLMLGRPKSATDPDEMDAGFRSTQTEAVGGKNEELGCLPPVQRSTPANHEGIVRDSHLGSQCPSGFRQPRGAPIWQSAAWRDPVDTLAREAISLDQQVSRNPGAGDTGIDMRERRPEAFAAAMGAYGHLELSKMQEDGGVPGRLELGGEMGNRHGIEIDEIDSLPPERPRHAVPRGNHMEASESTLGEPGPCRGLLEWIRRGEPLIVGKEVPAGPQKDARLLPTLGSEPFQDVKQRDLGAGSVRIVTDEQDRTRHGTERSEPASHRVDLLASP